MDFISNEALEAQLDRDWAANLIQVFGHLNGRTPTPQSAEAFLKLLTSSSDKRGAYFCAHFPNLIKKALQTWRKPEVSMETLWAQADENTCEIKKGSVTVKLSSLTVKYCVAGMEIRYHAIMNLYPAPSAERLAVYEKIAAFMKGVNANA